MIKLLWRLFLLILIALAILFLMHKEKMLKQYKDLKKAACHFITDILWG